MPIQGEYMGMMLTVDDVDSENREFFRYCAAGDFRDAGQEVGRDRRADHPLALGTFQRFVDCLLDGLVRESGGFGNWVGDDCAAAKAERVLHA